MIDFSLTYGKTDVFIECFMICSVMGASAASVHSK